MLMSSPAMRILHQFFVLIWKAEAYLIFQSCLLLLNGSTPQYFQGQSSLMSGSPSWISFIKSVTGFQRRSRATFVRTSRSIPVTSKYPPGLTNRTMFRKHIFCLWRIHMAKKVTSNNYILRPSFSNYFGSRASPSFQIMPALIQDLIFNLSPSLSNISSVSFSVRRPKGRALLNARDLDE